MIEVPTPFSLLWFLPDFTFLQSLHMIATYIPLIFDLSISGLSCPLRPRKAVRDIHSFHQPSPPLICCGHHHPYGTSHGSAICHLTLCLSNKGMQNVLQRPLLLIHTQLPVPAQQQRTTQGSLVQVHNSAATIRSLLQGKACHCRLGLEILVHLPP